MAWTSPKTWVAGAAHLAADLNAHVRDNLTWLKTRPFDSFKANEVADFTTASTSFVDVTAFTVTLPATFTGGKVFVLAAFSHKNSGVSNINYFNLYSVGAAADLIADDGVGLDAPGTVARFVVVPFLIENLVAGAQELRLRIKVSAGTATIWTGAGTVGADVHPWMMAIELGEN